jgi:hypothetical protein
MRYYALNVQNSGSIVSNNINNTRDFATASKKKKKKKKASSDSNAGASLGRAISQEDIQMHLEMVDPQNRVEV